MTTRQFIKIEQQLANNWNGSVVNGRQLLMNSSKFVLCGLSFDGSGFSKEAFYVTYFAMPLYVPINHIVYLIGDRLRDGQNRGSWDANSPSLVAELSNAVKQQSQGSLERWSSLEGFASALGSTPYDPNRMLAHAFALVLLSKPEEASKEIHRLLSQLDLSVPWQRTIRDQAEHIRSLLGAGGDAAQQQLEQWTNGTRQALLVGTEMQTART